MTRTPEPLELSEAEAIDVAYTLRDIKPEDIVLEWIHKMVNRLFKELKRQLKSVEKFSAAANPEQTEKYLKNARTIHSMQSSLSKLVELKVKIDGIRATKAVRKPKETRERIAKQLVGQVERSAKASISGKTE
jgi:hypothetical protein